MKSLKSFLLITIGLFLTWLLLVALGIFGQIQENQSYKGIGIFSIDQNGVILNSPAETLIAQLELKWTIVEKKYSQNDDQNTKFSTIKIQTSESIVTIQISTSLSDPSKIRFISIEINQGQNSQIPSSTREILLGIIDFSTFNNQRTQVKGWVISVLQNPNIENNFSEFTHSELIFQLKSSTYEVAYSLDKKPVYSQKFTIKKSQ